MWFMSSKENDDEIRDKFQRLLWENRIRPPSLGAILLYDQVPRNTFRGKATAFMFDEEALRMCNALKHDVHQMRPFEAHFLLLPLMHSEVLADQEECVKIFKELVTNVEVAGNEGLKEYFMKVLENAEDHMK
jgi:uncharacterized protein (DUF924 family)